MKQEEKLVEKMIFFLGENPDIPPGNQTHDMQRNPSQRRI